MLLFVSCGSHHVLTGSWSQETTDGKEGVVIQFDDTGTRISVHAHHRADQHPKATFTFDAATKAMTIECALGDGKATTWKGSLNGDVFELTSADGKMTFRRGGQAHGH